MGALAERQSSPSSLWLGIINALENLEKPYGYPQEHERYLTKKLGSGNFAWVYECPWDKTLAIKVGAGPGKQGAIYDDGWIHYAAHAIKKRREGDMNPLLIDVHELYIGQNRRWYCALMDKYDSTIDEYKHRCRGAWEDKSNPIRAKYDTMHMVMKGRRAESFCPEYLQYCAQLRIDRDFITDDLHDGNVMMKGARLIITDPFGGSDRSYSKKALGVLQHLGILPRGEEYMHIPPQELHDRDWGIVKPGSFHIVAGHPDAHNRPRRFANHIANQVEIDAMDGLNVEKLIRAKEMLMQNQIPDDAWRDLGAFGKMWVDHARFNSDDDQLLNKLGVGKPEKKPKVELKGWKKDKAHLKGINDQPKPRRK